MDGATSSYLGQVFGVAPILVIVLAALFAYIVAVRVPRARVQGIPPGDAGQAGADQRVAARADRRRERRPQWLTKRPSPSKSAIRFESHSGSRGASTWLRGDWSKNGFGLAHRGFTLTPMDASSALRTRHRVRVRQGAEQCLCFRRHAGSHPQLHPESASELLKTTVVKAKALKQSAAVPTAVKVRASRGRGGPFVRRVRDDPEDAFASLIAG